MPGAGNPTYSSDTSREIDAEVRGIVDGCYHQARTILEENIDILHAMKAALMEYETLDSEQVGDLMARRPVRPPYEWRDDNGGSKPDGGAPAPAESGAVGGPAREH